MPSIYHIFNTVYGVDLYNSGFHFIFDDVGKNGLNELYKDVPDLLLTYMTDHIKRVSGDSLRTETEKVDDLFGNMQISYQMNTGKFMNFKQGQELASGIKHFLKHQRPDVPEKCFEVHFSTSRIYPSLVVGVVDGLNIDKLFSQKQAVPTTPSLRTTGNHLATIATTMSTTVTGLTSKAAANHVDTDRKETIDYKDMPNNVREQYDLKNLPENNYDNGRYET